jgi:nucleotide-binding universal stress UspA family protein
VPLKTTRSQEKTLLPQLDTTPILLCYDGSEDSRRAIDTAASLFPGHAAIVLNVWSPMAVIAAMYGGAVSIPAYDDRALREAAVSKAQEGADRASAAGLSATAQTADVTYDGTWHAILAVADECDATLIVLGARGLSAFKSLVLGSVSHGVAQHARRAVLVVPPPGSAASETT